MGIDPPSAGTDPSPAHDRSARSPFDAGHAPSRPGALGRPGQRAGVLRDRLLGTRGWADHESAQAGRLSAGRAPADGPQPGPPMAPRRKQDAQARRSPAARRASAGRAMGARRGRRRARPGGVPRFRAPPPGPRRGDRVAPGVRRRPAEDHTVRPGRGHRRCGSGRGAERRGAPPAGASGPRPRTAS